MDNAPEMLVDWYGRKVPDYLKRWRELIFQYVESLFKKAPQRLNPPQIKFYRYNPKGIPLGRTKHA